MKYSKITPLIKKHKHLSIHTRKGSEQWISNGNAAYPVLGMPVMSETEMLTFLNFQQNDNINVIEWEADDINLTDTDRCEELINAFGPALIINGDPCATFLTSMGALIVKEKYLAPCYTHYGEGELTFWLRKTTKLNPFIAVKKGLYLLAAILPLKTWGVGDHTLEEYEKLCAMIKVANENMARLEEFEEGKADGTS